MEWQSHKLLFADQMFVAQFDRGPTLSTVSATVVTRIISHQSSRLLSQALYIFLGPFSPHPASSHLIPSFLQHPFYNPPSNPHPNNHPTSPSQSTLGSFQFASRLPRIPPAQLKGRVFVVLSVNAEQSFKYPYQILEAQQIQFCKPVSNRGSIRQLRSVHSLSSVIR